MDVYRGEDPLPESELLGQLNAIVEFSASHEDYPSVGTFTTLDRRLWGKVYRKLKKGKIFDSSRCLLYYYVGNYDGTPHPFKVFSYGPLWPLYTPSSPVTPVTFSLSLFRPGFPPSREIKQR